MVGNQKRAIAVSYSRTLDLHVTLERDEDGCWYLEKVTYPNGSDKCTCVMDGPVELRGMCDLCALQEEWKAVGSDNIDEDAFDHYSWVKVKAHFWWDQDYYGDYDGGLEIEEVLESKPCPTVRAESGFVVLKNCPYCQHKHIVEDTNHEFETVPCMKTGKDVLVRVIA